MENSTEYQLPHKLQEILCVIVTVSYVYRVFSFRCVDVEAFAKAMEGSDTKTDDNGDSKDKKDDDEDMSLD